MFTIDGESFPNICVQNITRGFEINDGKNEGYSISGLHMRDITGTYMTYTVVLDTKSNNFQHKFTTDTNFKAPINHIK